MIKMHVFYNRASWHSLLKNAIFPFIKHVNKLNIIELFLLDFSYDRGDHITLTLHVPHNNIDSLEKCINKYIKKYINLNPSALPTQNLIKQSFFIDFPNNSVRYNLFRDKEVVSHIIDLEMRSYLSESMLNLLVIEGVDVDSLLLFLVFLSYILFIHNDSKIADRAADNDFVTLCNLLNTSSLSISKKAEIVFHENKKTLSLFFDEINKNIEFSKRVLLWNTRCQKNFDRITSLNQKFISLFRYLTLLHPLINEELFLISIKVNFLIRLDID